VYQVKLVKVTSYIIFTNWRGKLYTGTLQELERRARWVLVHNLLFGWWGFPMGLMGTPAVLVDNSRVMRRLRARAAQGLIIRG
jgi:hypothetical protein